MYLSNGGTVYKPGKSFLWKTFLQSLAAAFKDFPCNQVVVIRDRIAGKVPAGQFPGIIREQCKENRFRVWRDPRARAGFQKGKDILEGAETALGYSPTPENATDFMSYHK